MRAGGHQRQLQRVADRRGSEPFDADCSAKCAPMPARSTLGDHSAAVPFSATTWRDAEAPRRCAGCCRRCRHPAAGRAPRWAASARNGAALGRVDNDADRRPATPARSARRTARRARSSTAPRLLGQRRAAPAAPRRIRRPAPAQRPRRRAQRRPRTGARPRARACADACGRPPGRARSLRSRTSSGLSRELIGSGAAIMAQSAAPRAPARSCAGAAAQAPCARSASRCSAVG